ncbi:hypothetical protein WMZ97_20250 [Lentibacillus sp. N15]|uniref:hypothetical protein n=1 Tax=Lentibacillus songyuanensis TaxID=3136161 RepID=UPI0031BACE08
MGTDYSIGVIRNFTAEANQNVSLEEWQTVLHDRLDLDCYTLTPQDTTLTGELDATVFRDNIAGFYQFLQYILEEDRNPNVDYYFEEFGTELSNYQNFPSYFSLKKKNGLSIQLHCNMALLFVEGKVMVEEFYTEPVMMNWLFRNSKIENKLAGCIVSGIIG